MTDDRLRLLYREVRILTHIVTKLMHQTFEQHLDEAGVGVSGVQFAILRMLHFQPYTLTELSRKFVVDPSTLVPVIDGLVKKGYVERERDPKDRRRAPLVLTETGHELVARCPMPDGKDALSNALARMEPEKVQQYVAFLRELLGNMPDGEEIMREIDERLIQAEQLDTLRRSSADPSAARATS